MQAKLDLGLPVGEMQLSRNSITPPGNLELNVSYLDDQEIWEVPPKAPTQFLSHGYLRYIGKFTPQLAHKFIESYTQPGELVIDPMCGSGTTLIEALRLKRKALGTDINETALLTSKVTTQFIDPKKLDKVRKRFEAFLASTDFSLLRKNSISKELAAVTHYFNSSSLNELLSIQTFIDDVEDRQLRDFYQLALLSILRVVSKANVKKMNTEIDPHKKAKPVLPTFIAQLKSMTLANKVATELGMIELSKGVKVTSGVATKVSAKDGSASLVVLHPPYLSGTAFSETVQLQLAWMNINHKDTRKQELAMRGSYFHVPNGLQKYLVGWNSILKEAYRLVKPGGYCACVIGDGQVSYTRIPMTPITVEFAKDIGFQTEKIARNLLNHNTGRTLNKKMKFQEIIILRKPDEK